MAGIALGISAAGWAAIAATTATTTASFVQAGQARKRMRKAQEDAVRALDDARATLVNPYAALSVPIEKYEQQREALITAAAGVTGAANQRGVGAAAGAALGATQRDLQKSRADIEKTIFDLDVVTAKEEARLLDEERKIETGIVEGAQQAVADEQDRRTMAISQGVEGVANLGITAFEQAPLFMKSKAARSVTKAIESDPKIADTIASAGTIGDVDVSGFADLTPQQQEAFLVENFEPYQMKRFDELMGIAPTLPPTALPSSGVGTGGFDALSPYTPMKLQ